MDKVTFADEGHKYTHLDGREFISVTTLISRYKNPFDSQYWSLYKAIKDVLVPKNLWSIYKASAGGWEDVVDYWSKEPIFEKSIRTRQNWYLEQWKEKSETALKNGTEVHNAREAEIKSQSSIKVNGVDYAVSKSYQSAIIEFPDFEACKVFTEPLLYNEAYGIAGKADKVIQSKKDIVIKDYKTNEEISFTAFRDAVMKSPLDVLSDCDFSHFTLQLSTYGWMLEQHGYNVKGLFVVHTRTNRELPVPYKKNLVESMIQNYVESTGY
jgi:hypothetical protein